jgi:hypothetical protein
MAFLDNSGDIILDAVLTDLGRKRLAEGNFSITQFAFGDDEIDYALYDKDHPSGSAYYDLEILQTPVFESFTSTNANVNYGLLSFNGNEELLYLPTMKVNTKSIPVNTGQANIQKVSGVVYAGATGNNATTIINNSSNTIGSSQMLIPEAAGGVVLIETGLDTTDIDRSLANRSSYVVQNGLVESDFKIAFDSRFIGGVFQLSNKSTFKYGANDLKGISLALDDSLVTATSNAQIDNYKEVMVRAVDNSVEKVTTSGITSDNDVSSIAGPRASTTGFSVSIAAELQAEENTTPSAYSLYGKTNQNLFSDGSTYDYIDTTVYITGVTTGVNTQVTLRIIKVN